MAVTTVTLLTIPLTDALPTNVSAAHPRHCTIGFTNLIEMRLIAYREACKLDAKYITNFGEEVVRGQPVFVLSILLQKLEPMLRQAAGVAPWQVSPLLDLECNTPVGE